VYMTVKHASMNDAVVALAGFNWYVPLLFFFLVRGSGIRPDIPFPITSIAWADPPGQSLYDGRMTDRQVLWLEMARSRTPNYSKSTRRSSSPRLVLL